MLSSTLRRGIFTIFVDDNVDKNSSSVTAAGHFHETGVTVLEFSPQENPGIQRKQKIFKELQSFMPQSCESLKTFTTVNKINDKLEFHFCAETVNVPEKFSKCNLDKLKLYELINEEKWLTSFYDDVLEPTSWTGYHEKQSRDKTGNILTINAPLLLIH